MECLGESGNDLVLALRDKIRPKSKLKDAAKATVQVAGDLFKARSGEQKAVKKAWAEVGINIK